MASPFPPSVPEVDPGGSGSSLTGGGGYGRVGGSDAQILISSNVKYFHDVWDATGELDKYVETVAGAGTLTIDADLEAGIYASLSADTVNLQDRRAAIQLHKGSRTAMRVSVLCSTNNLAFFFGLAPIGDTNVISADPSDGIWIERDGGSSTFAVKHNTGSAGASTLTLAKTVGFNANFFNDFSLEIVQPPLDTRANADDAAAVIVARINNIIVAQKRVTGLPDDVDLCWTLQVGDADTGTFKFNNTAMAHYGAEFDPAVTL